MLIQSVGAVSVLGAGVLLGLVLGPEVQGIFGKTKSELEFASTAVMFGLPQTFLYYLSTGRMSVATSVKYSAASVVVCAVLALSYSAISSSALNIPFLAASILMLTHGHLRTILLASVSTLSFNVVTATPQLLILAGVIFWLISRPEIGADSIAFLFGLAFVVASAAAVFFLAGRQRLPRHNEFDSPTRFELARYSLAAWLPPLFATASAAMWMRHIDAKIGLAEVGLWTMGLLAVQIVLTPINYAAPLFFRRWANSVTPRHLARTAVLVGLATFVVTATLLQILRSERSVALSAYGGLLQISWQLSAIVAGELCLRIVNIGAYSSGKPGAVSAGEFVRFAVLCTALFFNFGDTFSSAANWWTAACLLNISTVIVAGTIRRKRGA